MEYVVVKADEEYTGGPGYIGPVLQALGFPIGPYGGAGAKILVRQAKTVDPKLKLKILPYIERA
jgi:hypothetical protein